MRGIGAPPQDRLAVAVPGKDAAPVGAQQALRRQVAAGRQQPVGPAQRLLDGREVGVAFEPGDQMKREA